MQGAEHEGEQCKSFHVLEYTFVPALFYQLVQGLLHLLRKLHGTLVNKGGMVALVEENHIFKILYPETQDILPYDPETGFKGQAFIVLPEITFKRCLPAFREKGADQFFLAPEINIQGTCGHTRLPGYFAHGYTRQAFFLYQVQHSIKYLLRFFIIT